MDKFISLAKKYGCRYAVNEAMSAHTSMKVGGAADFVLFANCEQVICETVRLAKEGCVPLTVLGNGSNVLVSDEGIRGVTVIIGKDMSDVEYLGGGVIFAQSGALLTKLCRCAMENSLTGLEFAYGIPGSCGGAVYMNAGAYGGEMKDVFEKSTHITPDGGCGELRGKEAELSYRHSAYYENGCIITGVYARLRQGDKTEIENKMNELMNRRKTKQPLEYPSAGSTFKRPEGYFAGALIEECNLKGKCVGGAQVSEKHAGFLINRGGAKCSDFLQLAGEVSEEVMREKGVKLEMEIRVLK